MTITDDVNVTTTSSVAVNSDYSDVQTEIVVKVLFVSIAALLLTISIPALIALNRTKKIPKTACILSTSLLWFDCATTFCFALRHMITDKIVLNLITLVGVGWFIASIANIGVMALDRMILFQFPYFYIRRFSNGSFVIFYYIIILLYLLTYTGRWVICFLDDPTFWELRQCMNPVIISTMATCFISSMSVSIPSFILIAIIIIKQRRRERSRSESNSTIVVFICCINYTFTLIVCFILMLTICQITIVVRRTATDVVFMFNGFVDTFVYVLWFKECRYELMKIVGTICPPLKDKIERMRAEVFDVSSVSNVA